MRNCWEFKKCGREPGGSKVSELGECPAATEIRLDGQNHGTKGGRMCWIMKCEFLKEVYKEEGREFSYGMKLWYELNGKGKE